MARPELGYKKNHNGGKVERNRTFCSWMMMTKAEEIEYRKKRIKYWLEKRKLISIYEYMANNYMSGGSSGFNKKKFIKEWQEDCDKAINWEKSKIMEAKNERK